MNIKNINNFDIFTPEGWCSFKSIKQSIIPYHFKITFNDGTYLKGSENHLVKLEDSNFWEISLLEEGEVLDGGKIVTKIEYIEEELIVYDILHINNKSNSYFSEGIIQHNCAFIDNVDEIWAAAQQTLSTGGGCIAMSTPYGTGNWFHKTFVRAEDNEIGNEFLPIKLPWFVHPERDEEWRKKQDSILGDPRMAAQECDAEFSTSGDTVFYNEFLKFIEETTITPPLERRGVDQNLWIWEPADYTQDFMIIADVARGDGKDSSTAHIMNITTNVQVWEYKGQLPPKEFGYFLIGLATEFNMALLIIENASIGWSTIETVMERGYPNLYYSAKQSNITADSYFNKFENNELTTPGFTTSQKTRPLLISKFIEMVNDKSVVIKSKRLLEEMKVFVWKNGRAEAQYGYNDDLVMAFAIGQYLRDTSLKYRQQSQDLTRAVLGNFTKVDTPYSGVYFSKGGDNPYSMNINEHEKEDFSWLVR